MTVAGNGTLIFLFPNAAHFHGGDRSGQNCVSKSYQKKRGM